MRSKKFWLAGAAGALSFYIQFIFLFQPLKGEKWISKIYKKPLKQTLAKAEAPLIASGMDIRVLKVQHGDKIFLEFLSKERDESFFLINSLQLKGSREASYELLGKTGSLFVADADGDGALDTLAPAFDKLFRRHENIASYNPKTKKFELRPYLRYPQIIPAKSWGLNP